MAVFIALFTLASFLVAVFPCHPPHVWGLLGVECLDQFSFWEAFAGVNIVIESTLVLFPVFVIYPLRMNGRRKAILVSCFAARLLYVSQSFCCPFFSHQAANILKSYRSFRRPNLRSPKSEATSF